MDVLVNDLSVHGQFQDMAGFQEALARLMTMRATAQRFGREVQCCRAFLNTTPMPNMPLQQAIGNLGKESERRAIMIWLTRSGPFWDDLRQHDVGDWLKCRGDIVTDTAAGEAAFRQLHGVECGLVSVSPSDWCDSPLEVTWVRAAEGLDDRSAVVENWWDTESFEAAMQHRAPSLSSWGDLRNLSNNRFTSLVFADDCFAPLEGVPFARAAADRFVALLDVLDRFACAFDNGGVRTAEGNAMYQDYFTGDRGWFSDSSSSERNDFRQELTFTHPEDRASRLFCTWHGKVSYSTLRLHFSWPIKAGRPVYIVYAGPKITRN